MSEKFLLEKKSVNQWLVMNDLNIDESLISRCTISNVQEAIKDFPNVKVASAEIVNECMGEKDIPKTFHIILEETSEGGNIVTINVWLPLNWNERFLACLGGGIRTHHLYNILGRQNRIAMPAYVLKNNFATANTDGGVPGEVFSWGLNTENKGINYELILNYAYRSTHSMAVIAKKVISHIYGKSPKYNYAQGASNGGKQSIVESQIFGSEFDGLWSADPAINFIELFMSMIWPLAVMNSENHVITPQKLDFLRSKCIEKNNGKYNFVQTLEKVEFDPNDYIGEQCEDGIFTEKDAKIATLIYIGPKDLYGKSTWYGFRPESKFWSNGELGQPGTVVYTHRPDGTYEPVINQLALGVHGEWLARNLKLESNSITYETFNELYNIAKRDFNVISANNPDLRKFKENGCKLLVTQALNDDTIIGDGAIDFYKNVIDLIGNEEDVQSFYRFFVSPGGGHTDLTQPGLSFTLADGMISLMNWVERGIEPISIPAVQHNFKLNGDVLTGDIEIYTLGKNHVVNNLVTTDLYAELETLNAANQVSSRLNRNTPISQLLADSEASVLLEEAIGDLLKNPQMEQAKFIPLLGLRDIMPIPSIQEKIDVLISQIELL